MCRVVIALPLALVLLIAPAAYAGGWATVGLSSTPAGTQPGTPWRVEVTVRQHGVTPLEGVEPAVIITRGDARKTFAATPTGKPGVYRADVVFPTAGRWTYAVDDGFISERPHTFPAVQIGAGTSAPARARRRRRRPVCRLARARRRAAARGRRPARARPPAPPPSAGGVRATTLAAAGLACAGAAMTIAAFAGAAADRQRHRGRGTA